MDWLIICIIAYLLNAGAIVVDKFLLSKKISNPAVYTFFISALSLAALVLIPFGFKFYPLDQIVVAVVGGIFFAYALLFMFKALRQNEASRITPFIGGLQPIFIFILAWFFLQETFSAKLFVAFVVIILGTIVIAWHRDDNQSNPSKNSQRTGYLLALISTILFAISYTISKYAYIQQGFVSGFVWTRVGAFLGALFLLLIAQNRQDIIKEIKKPQKNTSLLFLVGQAAGAISFILVNKAMDLAQSIALVNALRGLEYVFLLLIVLGLHRKFPQLLEEKITPAILAQKIIATGLIIAGLIILIV
ncbi:MAG TPA: GRP family sugar transporter [bacterium]|nr:GRP family sugar transporter [bacterium]HNS34257.1 GRP family sugar transporter [bacterium]